MSLALLTRGYVCAPTAQLPSEVTIGPGPTIVQVVAIKPDIDHGRELAPRIDKGEEVPD